MIFKMNVTRYIKVYENAIDAQFCDKIIKRFKKDRKLHTGPGRQKLNENHLGNPDSKWTELRIDDLAQWNSIREKLVENCQVFGQQYINEVEAYIPVEATLETFRMKWYQKEKKEKFAPHIDADKLATGNRCLTFLWYLTDVSQGGETNFVTLDYKSPAKKGSLLIFPPYWMYPHMGEVPISNDKYIIGTFLSLTG
jgi:prolyl 4-hydroxylase